VAGCWASEAKAVEAGWAEAPGGSAAEGSVTAAAAMVAETAEMARGGGPSVDSPSGQSPKVPVDRVPGSQQHLR
jgi:hypothetical protein